MANCPNCGSNHIQLKRETNVNWGRTVAGWALFGVVGGAVGAVTGEDRNANACLDCGTSWKAADLYKTLQTIKNLTGATLDLAREQDRLYMKSFISDVGSYIEAVSEAKKRAENLVTVTDGKAYEKTLTGCTYGCITSLGICFVIASAASIDGLLWIVLIPPVAGFFIGKQRDKANKKSFEQEMIRVKIEATDMKIEAEKNLKLNLNKFIENHPL